MHGSCLRVGCEDQLELVDSVGSEEDGFGWNEGCVLEWRTGSIRFQLIIHPADVLSRDVHRSPRSEGFLEKARIASEAQSWLTGESIIRSRSLIVRRGRQYVKVEVGH
ncbi:hypothetical protein KC19_2G247500 [Ceratodon purpureus]|uniref:Uncharacterized protein n=1 Tax=Ceratodon purpureus TaxID=3225 RepID=A0A8T0IXM4_CERPU|nr:hypothetical protein KC19_2G247500 [Ceratodon purpureus]